MNAPALQSTATKLMTFGDLRRELGQGRHVVIADSEAVVDLNSARLAYVEAPAFEGEAPFLALVLSDRKVAGRPWGTNGDAVREEVVVDQLAAFRVADSTPVFLELGDEIVELASVSSASDALVLEG